MSDITVYLSTTKWTVATDSSNPEILIKLDIPVCCSAMMIGSFGFTSHENETTEHYWSNVMLDMAKFVHIDTQNKTVYIGNDQNRSPESSLIEYAESSLGEYSKHFFERWEQIQTLLFEFTIFDIKNKPRFSLKGIWLKDHWEKLEIFPANHIEIASPPK